MNFGGNFQFRFNEHLLVGQNILLSVNSIFFRLINIISWWSEEFHQFLQTNFYPCYKIQTLAGSCWFWDRMNLSGNIVKMNGL